MSLQIEALYEFKITIGEWYEKNITAPTAGKAKYQIYRDFQDGIWEVEFAEFIKKVKCHKVGPSGIHGLFRNKEDFKRMCKNRNLSFAYQGMIVEVDGKKGILIGAYGMNLAVIFEGQYGFENCHPHWKTKYFGSNGELVKEYGD